MRKVIICNAVGEQAESELALSLPTFEAYGAKYDYQVFTGCESPADLSPHWGKIPLLQSAVQEYDLVLWLDTDAMILDFSEDIADQIETDCFQALLMEQEGSRWNANTGVWLLKGGQQSLDFLNEVWELGPVEDPFSWHDQAAVIKALGWSWSGSPKVCKITNPSPYLAATSWLKPEWNRIPLLYPQIKARIQHWAGGPDNRQKRIEEMGQILEVMRGSGMLGGA